MQNAFWSIEKLRNEHPGAQNGDAIALFPLHQFATVERRNAPLRVVWWTGANSDLVPLRSQVFTAPGVHGGDSGFVRPVIDAENQDTQLAFSSLQSLSEANAR